MNDPTWLSWHRDLLEAVAASRPEVVFLGDSITFAWTTTGLDTWRSDFTRYDALDLGLPGDTTQNVLWRIDHGELSGIRPRVVVVLIGTNNLAAADPADVARGIETVVDDARSHQPHAAVLLLGVLPIGAPASPLHVRAPAVDALLARHPFGAGVRLLDLSPSFTYRDGRLRPELYHRVCLAGTVYCDTLVHPSAAGYALMGRRILPVLSSMLR